MKDWDPSEQVCYAALRKSVAGHLWPNAVERALFSESPAFRIKSDLTATESRLIKAIEQAKTKVLLVVRVSDLSARNAELEAQLAEIAKRGSQHQ